MIVGIAGSRNYPEPQEVIQFVYSLATQFPHAFVVSGGRGIVDETAEKFARTVGLDVISFRPVEVSPKHFEMVTYAYGDRAANHVDKRGLRNVKAQFETFAGVAAFRNMYVVGESQRLIAFWDGESRGTKGSIDLARLKGIPISCKRPGMPMTIETQPARGGRP